jgi:hypothetical protein
LTLILGVLLLGACGGPLPNGKKGVLAFNAPPDVIRSADYAVLIPHQWRGSNGGLDSEYEYDFQGKEVEATGTGGLSVLSTSFDLLSERDFRIRVRCGGEHGKKEELRVRIHSGWQTHYEDAFDITCWEPNEMTFEGAGPWITGSKFIGKMQVAFVSEQGRVDLSRQFRDEYYIDLPDPEGRLGYLKEPRHGPDRPQYLHQLWLETQTPGTNAELLLGERRITFPVEVLPDEAWNLKVELVSSGEVRFPIEGKAHTLRGSAVLPNGDTVRSLNDCRWVVKSGGADVPTYESCYITAVTHGLSSVVCAQTRGKEVCLTLDR